jgi:diguanylate cyclase (GGDEF)-like protein
MIFDQTSLLIGIGFSGAAIGVTLLMSWLGSRSEQFLIRLAFGVCLIVGGVAIFATYGENYSTQLHWLAFGLVMAGLAVAWNSARHFRLGRAPLGPALGAALLGIVVTGIPFMLGYDGLGAILANLACAGLLVATATEMALARDEAPVPILSAAALYLLTAISFSLCALALVIDGSLILEGAPANWAEELNAMVGIFTITGIGALSLALNQSRLARRHRSDALTDPLTGLLNRRALFDRFGQPDLGEDHAVLLCDLDNFKRVNDQHGHAAGDDVLRGFAAVLRKVLRQSDSAARLGGEEFAIVLPNASPAQAMQVAERIRSEFSALGLETLAGRIQCTVSIGAAIRGPEPESLEVVLHRADGALYKAKSSGRDRVTLEPLHLVA